MRIWARLSLRAAVAAALGLQAGCLDLSLLADAAFPSTVPGLPADEAWLSLPVGAWVNESGLEARAVSACLPESCGRPAAVALLRAPGERGAVLAQLLDDPARLERELKRRIAARPPAKAAVGPTGVSVERRREGGLAGVAVRLARPDGSRTVAGLALHRREAGATLLLLVIAADEDAARALARSVASALG